MPNKNKSTKKTSEPKIEKKERTWNSYNISLILIGLLVLAFSVWWIYFVLNKAQIVANYLPASTSAYFQLDNSQIDELEKTHLQEFIANTDLSEEQIDEFVNSFLGVAIESNYDFVGDSFAVVLMDGYTDMRDGLVFFVEIANYGSFKEFLSYQLAQIKQDKLQEITLEDHSYYVYPGMQNFYFVRLGDYLVLSSEISKLQAIDNAIDEGTTLAKESKFQNLINNLRQYRPIFAYLNFANLTTNQQDALNIKDLFQKNLVDIFERMALEIDIEDGRLFVESFVSFSDEARMAFSNSSVRNKYRANLKSVLNDSYDMILAGQDLTMDIDLYKSALNNLHPSSALVLDGILEAQKDKFFGEEIPIEDLMDFLSSEYQIAIKQNESEQEFLLALDLSELDQADTMIRNLIDLFVSNNPLGTPKLETVILEDGTSMQKLVANFDSIEELDSLSYEDFNIITLGSNNNSNRSISLAMNNDWLFASLDIDLLTEAIDQFNQSDEELEVLADDIVLFSDQVVVLSDKYLDNYQWLQYFQKLVIGEKFFEDGIALKSYIY